MTLVSLLAEEKVDGRPHLSASRLLERRREFHRNLVNIVREHHKVRGTWHWACHWGHPGCRTWRFLLEMGSEFAVTVTELCWAHRAVAASPFLVP